MNDFDLELPLSDVQLHFHSRFDYGRLEESTRILALSRAGEIKILMKQNTENIIQIGVKLIEVKQCLGHGQFRHWLAAEFDWSKSTANQFMNVALKCPNFGHLETIAPSALYLLAAPSTPDEVRSIALERASRGDSEALPPLADRISHKVAKQILSDVKETTGRAKPPQPALSHPAPAEEMTPPDVTPDNVPSSPVTKPSYQPMKETSSFKWIRDSLQNRIMQILLYDEEMGMKIERLAREYERQPHTIVEWGIEAFEEMPQRKREILDLESKLQEVKSQNSEQAQTIVIAIARTAELEEKLAAAEQLIASLQSATGNVSSVAELETQLYYLATREAHRKIVELSGSVVDKNSKISELENQLAAFQSAVVTAQDEKIAELEASNPCENSKPEELQIESEHLSLPSPTPTPSPAESDLVPTDSTSTDITHANSQSQVLPPVIKSKDIPNLKPILKFFDLAAAKVNTPSVTIEMNGHTITISRNSTKYPGALNIKSTVWLGRINKDGSLYKGWEWQDWLLPILEQFAQNPTLIAQQHGKTTGACCFCNRTLKDSRSIATGYGEICASHYGLPWPIIESTQKEPFRETFSTAFNLATA